MAAPRRPCTSPGTPRARRSPAIPADEPWAVRLFVRRIPAAPATCQAVGAHRRSAVSPDAWVSPGFWFGVCVAGQAVDAVVERDQPVALQGTLDVSQLAAAPNESCDFSRQVSLRPLCCNS